MSDQRIDRRKVFDDAVIAPETRTTGSEGQPAASSPSSRSRDQRDFDYPQLDQDIVLPVRVLREANEGKVRKGRSLFENDFIDFFVKQANRLPLVKNDPEQLEGLLAAVVANGLSRILLSERFNKDQQAQAALTFAYLFARFDLDLEGSNLGGRDDLHGTTPSEGQ